MTAASSNPSGTPQNGDGPLREPPLRENGITNASDGELREGVDRFEGWANLGGIAVVVGVVAEIALAAYNAAPGTFLFRWGAAVADAIIAGGVGAEVLFAKKASARQGELLRRSDERVAQLEFEAGFAGERAAQTLERAAALERETAGLRVELAKVKAPLTERRLTPEQSNELAKALQGSGLRVSIMSASTDRETKRFAEDFAISLSLADCFAGISWGGSVVVNGINAIPDGVNISGDDKAALEKLAFAMRTAGISFGTVHPPFGGSVRITVGSHERVPS